MKKIAVLFGAAAIVASGLLVAPAQAEESGPDYVEIVVEQVRARVCVEEHGYGVINCSESVDPTVSEVEQTISPVTDRVWGAVGTAWETANWAVDEGPGIVREEVNYTYCWIVDPTNPYCSGPISD